MAEEKDSEYSVGYRKPPRHSQFKPGRSGNPKGRPRKKQAFEDDFQAEMNSTITANVGGRAQTITKSQLLPSRLQIKPPKPISHLPILWPRLRNEFVLSKKTIWLRRPGVRARNDQLSLTEIPDRPMTNQTNGKASSGEGSGS